MSLVRHRIAALTSEQPWLMSFHSTVRQTNMSMSSVIQIRVFEQGANLRAWVRPNPGAFFSATYSRYCIVIGNNGGKRSVLYLDKGGALGVSKESLRWGQLQQNIRRPLVLELLPHDI